MITAIIIALILFLFRKKIFSKLDGSHPIFQYRGHNLLAIIARRPVIPVPVETPDEPA
jgi:hypothetical protein